jgi:hypothetical protein
VSAGRKDRRVSASELHYIKGHLLMIRSGHLLGKGDLVSTLVAVDQ